MSGGITRFGSDRCRPTLGFDKIRTILEAVCKALGQDIELPFALRKSIFLIITNFIYFDFRRICDG